MTLRHLLGFSSLVFSRSICSGPQTSSVQDLSDLLVVVRKLIERGKYVTSFFFINKPYVFLLLFFSGKGFFGEKGGGGASRNLCEHFF